jgi:myo-inositol-1(or 4)-monophosphatase
MKTIELKEIIWKSLPGILDRRSEFKMKNDGSYVSQGDLFVQSIVEAWAKKRFPKHLLISEERDYANSPADQNGNFLVLDPIDGTENFISGLKEWGIGLSIYTNDSHEESCIFLPELNDYQISGMPMKAYSSRIMGLSSSLTADDIASLKWAPGTEFRIIGCAMYNLLMTARGSFKTFENLKGANCWDILPGLNLAREAGCNTFVDNQPYLGQMLFPTKKYCTRVWQGEN